MGEIKTKNVTFIQSISFYTTLRTCGSHRQKAQHNFNLEQLEKNEVTLNEINMLYKTNFK